MTKRLALFVHGLSGSAASTWEQFPDLLRASDEIASRYDIATYDYPTSIFGDLPSLPLVADALKTEIDTRHSAYGEIAIIAHSQGGLVARQYIADRINAEQRLPVTRLLTFATPHHGSTRASWLAKIPGTSTHVDALAFGSGFLLGLAKAWEQAKADARVLTRYVVAVSDKFVKSASAMGPTWNLNYEVVTEAGHLDLVKPTSTGHPSFQIASRFLLQDCALAGAKEMDHRQPLLRFRRLAPTDTARFFFGTQTLKFVGREQEMDVLNNFLSAPERPFCWTVLHGSGGVGKSRLALEACLALRDGWHAGFLDDAAEEPDWHRWQPLLPTLLVIDYAAKDTERVGNLLSALAARGQLDGTRRLSAPVRVLLVERLGAGDWLNRVAGTGEVGHRITAARWLPDIPLLTVSNPWLLIENVLNDAGQPLPNKDETLEALTRIDPERRPLFAHFMADAIAAGRDIADFDADRLLDDVINRWRDKFWIPAGARQTEERLLALATMTGGIEVSVIESLADRLLPQWDVDRHPVAFQTMTSQPAHEWIAALEPDVVGEQFVLMSLESDRLSVADRRHLVDLAWRLDAQSMAQFTFRAHRDMPTHPMLAFTRVPPTSNETLGYWFRTVIDVIDDLFARDPYAARGLINAAVERAFAVPFVQLTDFLVSPSRYGRGQEELAVNLWTRVGKEPAQLADQAFATTVDHVGSFLDRARAHGQEGLADALYKALGDNPQRLAKKALETTLDPVGAFLDRATAHGQKGLADALYKALEDNPQRLADQAFGTNLDQVGLFLDRARAHGQKGLADTLYTALAANPQRLTEQALRITLDQVGSFLDRARAHGQKGLADTLYTALAANPQRLAEHALRTPLEKVGSFLDRARAHGQMELVEAMWVALAAESPRLAKTLTASLPRQIMPLMVTIPEDLQRVGETITEPLDVKSWVFGEYRSKRFSTGAPGLALKFGNFGRIDLQDALLNNVLRRKNPVDFDDFAYGLLEVSRLICHAPEADQELIKPFLESVCTTRWLTRSFRTSATVILAGALTRIATYQRPAVIAHFWCGALRQRLKTEVDYLKTAKPEDLSAAVQFLGACSLSGLAIHRGLLRAAPLGRIGKLPSEILAHDPDSKAVDAWQRQLWFGMRVVASLASDQLMVDQSILEQTLMLWRSNLTETSSEPSSNPHKINESMVHWLTRCVATQSGHLLRGEPLWLLTGFPANPRMVCSDS